MILVSALGPLDIRDEARGSLTTVLAQPRRSALLAYLAVEGSAGVVARDALLTTFWPESDESRGRAALRQALAFLRRSLGEDALRREGDDGVGVDASRIVCDVVQFRLAVHDGRFADALALYRGELLAGLVVADAPAFEQWCSALRVSLARDAARAAAKVAESAAARDDWPGAIAHARRAQALAPFNEEHHRRLLRYLDRAGDRAGALAEYEAFAATLATALEVTPAPETVALVATLRERTISRDAAPALDHVGSAVDAGSNAVPRPSVTRVSNARWFSAAAVIASLALLLGVWRSRAAPSAPTVERLPARTRIVVVPLADETGDPTHAAVGRMAADWIIEGISRVPDIEVVPVMAVLATTRALAAAPGPNGGETWQSVAKDVGAGVAVHGTVYQAHDTLHLQVQVADPATGRLLRPVERVSVPSDSVMAGVDRLRTRVLAAVAPLADTVTHLRRAVAPPTYDAYRDYVAGLEAFVTGDVPRALDLFMRSAQVDTGYPMPRIAAAISYVNLDDANGAARLLAPLQKERDRLGPLERSTLDMASALLAGDLASAYDAVVRQSRIAPGTIGEYMVAELARKMNRPDEAVDVLRTLGPERGELRGWRPYWRELTYALHLRGSHAEELAAAWEARRWYPADASMLRYEVRANAALGDRRALDAALATLESVPVPADARGGARIVAVTEWLAHGHPDGARFAQDVAAWFDALPAVEAQEATIRRQHARILILSGRATESRARVAPLLTARPRSAIALSTLGVAGVAAAAVGDSAGARAMMTALATRAETMTAAERGLSSGEAPYWQSIIAAQLADTATAIARLRQARAAGLGMEPAVHAEPAFASLRGWPPFAALLASVAGARRQTTR